ncbi:breast carcinoma-amplified sequence 3 homolog isoform X2 [Sitophilus oryzae]|nr:breast carcinoma-amplified sequence 3 homolog isoform X2 [Sitophilus oryzae]
MSADSPSHTRQESASSMHSTVYPQPVTDPTILDSVAGFINDVVPATGTDTFDVKDQIQWAQFENLDFDESNFSLNTETPIPSSLTLVLGYTTGVQVWTIPPNGEAMELFSWRHGSVKVLRILPTPFAVDCSKRDIFEAKRPLLALVDVASHSSPTGSLNFYSIRTGEQVKQIKFKNQILDVLANRRSIIISFPEKIAIFDAFTLEDKHTVTGCYLSPGIQQNPVALGSRWLAFGDKKLVASRRSSGGNEGEGVQSYTATVLHAAKSLGRGLRELGDVVASSLTGNQMSKLGTSPNSPQAGGSSDVLQKGIVTILDVESPTTQNADGSLHPEAIVAHFVAHTEAIVWLQFGPCGMLLLTADKRGHDFHLFRIQPHPIGSALAAVHHLYTLHRGDTSAKVQDMCFSFDSRWVTVSTLRGTTHVFPITPYGGNIGVRTHTTPHVVNKMSRFHRSAGLTAEGRSNSPVSMFENPISSNFPYHNPRFAPFPHPTVISPLAQLRQPVYMQNVGTATPRQGRQRLTSSSEDNIALRITACFASARAWIDSVAIQREPSVNKTVKPVDSLFVMNCHGILVQYDLEPHCSSSIPKERMCDESPIELTVVAKAQWRLQRQPTSVDRPLPVPHQNLIFFGSTIPSAKRKSENSNDDDWLSQVEIITHAGPHRRLWMGPQFTFKTYTTTSGTPMSLADAQPLDLNRSKPVNMPITKANAVLIESSSASSSEQSLLDTYRRNCEALGAAGESQIKEDLADAMLESPGSRDTGGRCVIVSVKPPAPAARRAFPAPSPIAKVVNPLGTVVTVQSSDEETEVTVPEDDIIYENCDEALFRPMVSPKMLAYCKSSSAHAGNIMTKSLKADTEVTVRVLDRDSPHPSSWEDPKIQDIKGDMKVIVRHREVSDNVAVKKENSDISINRKKNRNDQTKCKENEIISNKSEMLESVNDPLSQSYQRIEPSIIEPEILQSNIKTIPTEVNSKPSKKSKSKNSSKKSSDESRSSSEREQDRNDSKQLSTTTDPLRASEVSKNSRTGSKKRNQNSKTNTSVIEDLPKLDDPVEYSVSLKLPAKSYKDIKPKVVDEVDAIPYADYDPSRIQQELEKELDDEVFENTNKTSDEYPTISQTKSFKKENTSKSTGILMKGLGISTDISFPALDEKLVNPEFPPLEENFFSLENISKVDKFEDAEDCGLPLEPVEKYFEETSQWNVRKATNDDIWNTVSTSEDNIDDQKKDKVKKKTRKPKAKLGVKIPVQKESSPDSNKSKDDFSDKIWTDVSTEIILPPPKKTSWSCIVAKPQKPLNIIENEEVTKAEEVESYTITIPRKSYSSVITEKLLDIETPEERNNFATSLDDLLEIDRSEELSQGSNKVPDFLKLSEKSSDDEKNGSGSSPVETTESSDEGKTGGIVVENNPKTQTRTGGKKKRRR